MVYPERGDVFPGGNRGDLSGFCDTAAEFFGENTTGTYRTGCAVKRKNPESDHIYGC